MNVCAYKQAYIICHFSTESFLNYLNLSAGNQDEKQWRFQRVKVRNLNTVPLLCPLLAVVFLFSLSIFSLEPLRPSPRMNVWIIVAFLVIIQTRYIVYFFNSLKFYCSGCHTFGPFCYTCLSDTLNRWRPNWQTKYIEQRSEIIFLMWLYHHIHNLLDCGTRFLLGHLLLI